MLSVNPEMFSAGLLPDNLPIDFSTGAVIASAVAGIATAGIYAIRSYEPDLLSSQFSQGEGVLGSLKAKMMNAYLSRNFVKDDEILGMTMKRLTAKQIEGADTRKLLNFFNTAKEFLKGRSIGLDPTANGVAATLFMIEDELKKRPADASFTDQVQALSDYCQNI